MDTIKKVHLDRLQLGSSRRRFGLLCHVDRTSFGGGIDELGERFDKSHERQPVEKYQTQIGLSATSGSSFETAAE
jgi:hypothetical protein